MHLSSSSNTSSNTLGAMRTMSVRCVTIVQRTCLCIVWGASLPFQQVPMAGHSQCVWPAARATYFYWHAQNLLVPEATSKQTTHCFLCCMLRTCSKSSKKACACAFSQNGSHLFFADRFGDVLVATTTPAAAAAADAEEPNLLLGHLQVRSVVEQGQQCRWQQLRLLCCTNGTDHGAPT
jgi:hypothetical protein